MTRPRRLRWAALTATAALAACSPHHASTGGGATLAAVRRQGYITCGASQGTVGFGAPDKNGYWRGLDVDTCRAVAAAVLGDKNKARFLPLSGEQRLVALQTGQVDILPRTFTWTLTRDASGINFTIPNYYDYVGFLAPKSLGATSPKGLKDASVCLQSGESTAAVLERISETDHLHIRPVIFDNVQATRAAFFAGRCDALVTDASALASVRATLAKNPSDYVIFPATDEVEALTPAVRQGDDQWFDIVKWSFEAMLTAEELGITQANVDEMRNSKDPRVRRFLGVDPGNGKALGLDESWAYRIIKQVGNYGEVFDRDVGKDSPLKIDRGLNRLQRDGGLMVPLPFE